MHTVLVCLLALSPLVNTAKSPNIVFIVADDLGWNDIGFNNPDIISPNLDAMARQGVILNQSYVQPTCTPSRNSFMSGYYPFRSGLQNICLLNQQASCAPLGRSLLPQELKKLGYTTHGIAKWHLGYCNVDCIPTERGFDSFYGFYNGQDDYYNYTVLGGYDFRMNNTVVTDQVGTYSSYVFTNYLKNLISDHDTDTPLFLYMPLQGVHTPLEAPKEYTDLYPNIKTPQRKIVSGMVTAMDDIIGNVTSSLRAKGMYDDTIFIFTSDNGGWTPFGASNYPLRGGKITIWEGGTRAAAFVAGRGVPTSSVRYDGMIHAVDWFPTIVAAAGGKIDNPDMDGINLWPAITSLTPSPRTEFIYNIDYTRVPVNGRAAIRQGDFKLIQGFAGIYNDWYELNKTYSFPDIGDFLLNGMSSCEEDQACQGNMGGVDNPFLRLGQLSQSVSDDSFLFFRSSPRSRRNVAYNPFVEHYRKTGDRSPTTGRSTSRRTVRAFHKLVKQMGDQSAEWLSCSPRAILHFIETGHFTRLYNLKEDPEERVNLLCKDPERYLCKAREMERRLDEYGKKYVDPIPSCLESRGDPSLTNNVWSPGFC